MAALEASTAALAPGYTTRRPTMADLPAALAMIVASDLADYGEPNYTEEELRDSWEEVDLATESWLIHSPDRELAGYLGTRLHGQERVEVEGYVHPAHRGQGVGTTLIRLSEIRAEALQGQAAAGERLFLSNAVNGRLAAATGLMETMGYSAARHFWQMAIELTEPPPAPHWPAGITVRSMASEEEERTAYDLNQEVFADHWGHVVVPFADWLRRKKATGFDPALWFFVEEGERLAGLAICGTYTPALGWIHNLGVRQPWRRRGLGRALLLHALGAFHASGTPKVALGVDAENETGATSLYESAGMHVAHHYTVYERPVLPARGER